MIKNLNLERVFEVHSILYEFNLNSCAGMHFEELCEFLEYYSFKFSLPDEGDYEIKYFNDDAVPFEDYTNEDFNSFPIELLEKSDKEIEVYAAKKRHEELEKFKSDKLSHMDNLKSQLQSYESYYNKIKDEQILREVEFDFKNIDPSNQFSEFIKFHEKDLISWYGSFQSNQDRLSLANGETIRIILSPKENKVLLINL